MSEFLSENFQVLEINFSIYLIRRVFIMKPNIIPHIYLLWNSSDVMSCSLYVICDVTLWLDNT